MNVFDEDYWNTPQEPAARWWTMCAACGRQKVLKTGDYCLRCALIDMGGRQYHIVNEDNVSKVVEATGIDGSFLLAKYRNLHELKCFYVLFFARGEWQDIVIDERFHVPSVMKHLFDRLED